MTSTTITTMSPSLNPVRPFREKFSLELLQFFFNLKRDYSGTQGNLPDRGNRSWWWC